MIKLFIGLTLLSSFSTFATEYVCRSENSSAMYAVSEKHGEIFGYHGNEVIIDLDGLRTEVMILEVFPSVRVVKFINEEDQVVAKLSNRTGETESILKINGDEATCVQK